VFQCLYIPESMEPCDHTPSSAWEPSLSAVQHPVRMRCSKWRPHLHCISNERILAARPDCRPHCISNRTMRHKRSLLAPSTRSLRGSFRAQRLVRSATVTSSFRNCRCYNRTAEETDLVACRSTCPCHRCAPHRALKTMHRVIHLHLRICAI
jgi:hypothetical protein